MKFEKLILKKLQRKPFRVPSSDKNLLRSRKTKKHFIPFFRDDRNLPAKDRNLPAKVEVQAPAVIPSIANSAVLSSNADHPQLTHSSQLLQVIEPPAISQITAEPVQKITPQHQGQLSTTDLIRPDETLRTSIESFLMDQRSPHTQRAYGKDLKRFIQFLLARKFALGPEQLHRSIIIAYKDSLIQEKLQHSTIDRHLATLKSFFQWLVEDETLLKNPANGVRFLNPKRISKTLGFTDEEVVRVLKIPDLHTRTGALHYSILMVLFYCGLRRSEVCALKSNQIASERGHIVLKLKGKGNVERLIVLIQPVWSSIKYYFRITRRDFSEDQFLFLPVKSRNSSFKKALDPSTIFYIVRKYAQQAGIQNKVSPHSCRATAISNARDHNVPDRAIQEFAGWASTEMITRYDKRKTSIEKSASHSIKYSDDMRKLPDPIFIQTENS